MLTPRLCRARYSARVDDSPKSTSGTPSSWALSDGVLQCTVKYWTQQSGLLEASSNAGRKGGTLAKA